MMDVKRSFVWLAAAVGLPCVVGQCDTSLNTIRLREVNADVTQERTYTICPGTELNIGTLDPKNNNELTGDFFFQARPNLRINCGPDGASQDNCTVIGGTLQVDGTDMLGQTEPPYNFVMSGFTFVDAGRYNFWGNMPGSVTFHDCIFRDNTRTIAPVLADYADSAEARQELKVTFSSCQFLNNKYFGDPSHGALIVGNGVQNRLTIQNTVFEGNDILENNTQPLRSSFLVETSGPLSVHNNCFLNNLVGVAPIASYVADVTVSKNFGQNTTGFVCPFLASFENSQQFEFYRPTCYLYGETDVCRADETRSPTMSPTDYPSSSPSESPSVSPSSSPTASPSDSPTQAPTITPKPTEFVPTARPSTSPTSMPTQSPTANASPKLPLILSVVATVMVSFWMMM